MAQTQLRWNKAQVHVKEEGTQDTYDNPDNDGTGMFMAENVRVTREPGIAPTPPDYVRGDGLTHDAGPPGQIMGRIEFDVRIKGSGAAGTAPDYGEALKACGLQEDIAASTNVIYYPITTYDGAGENPGPSYSCSVLKDGMRYGLAGCFSNLTVDLSQVGRHGIFRFSFFGAWQPVASDALEDASATYKATVAQAFQGCTATMNIGGSYAMVLRGVTLDVGNEMPVGINANKTYGVYGTRIVRRRSSGTMSVEDVLTATQDFDGHWLAGTAGVIIDGATIGATAGNIFELEINRGTIVGIDEQDFEGLAGKDLRFAVSSLATDVEGTNPDFELIFT